MLRGLFLCAALLLCAVTVRAETLRVAVYTVELARDGPGLLLRDILKGEDPHIDIAVRAIADSAPDVLLLCRFDYDRGLKALDAFANRLSGLGAEYPHRFALRPNTGMATGLDLDSDGRLGGPGDAQGYGRFAGQGGMAILSRLPIDRDAARDFSDLLWRDLPAAVLPVTEDGPFFTKEELAELRLSTTGHWDIPLRLPAGGILHLLAFHATPPVFDGPEDRNGLRNRDEVRFWGHYLDGALDLQPTGAPFVLLGNANLDPLGGDGHSPAMASLLSDPRLQDPRPVAPEYAIDGQRSSAIAASDTAVWNLSDGPDRLRVDYVLPSATLSVRGSGVHWPDAVGQANGPRHRLVWVDIALP